MSFTRRHIDLTFQLGQGSFGEDGSDTVDVSGLRVSASIQKYGLDSMSQAQLRIYGLSLSVMNQLSTLGKPLAFVRDNKVSVAAGSDDTAMATVFQGTIQDAYVDMNGAPDGVFMVNAFAGLLAAVKPVDPISVKGPVDVAGIIAGLAVKMGLTFENSGVTAQLPTTYLPGTARQQLLALCTAANINCVIDNGVLAIWPQGGSRGGEIPLINVDTGMVGYPAHTSNGIALRTLFNPSINFGGQVQVQSTLEPANGLWTVFSVTMDLESEMPGGAWFTNMQGAIFGHVPVTSR